MKIKSFFRNLILVLLLFVFIGNRVYAQEKWKLTLFNAIEIAQDSALDAFRSKHTYLSAYWSYRRYLSQKLPTLDLSTTPASFNQSIAREFNFADSTYRTVNVNNFSTDLSLSLSQNIVLTGGQLSMRTSVNRFENFSNIQSRNITDFAVTPVSISYSQPLFAHNNYKWMRKIAPKEYEIAKKEYIRSQEEIALQTIDAFFNLLIDRHNLSVAEKNLENADTLYSIGEKRYTIASIERTDLLTLQLDLVNSRTAVKSAQNDYNRSLSKFLSLLRLPSELEVALVLPSDIPNVLVDPYKALQVSKELNPDFLNYELQRIQGESELDMQKRMGGLNSTLSASFGLNQSANKLINAYEDPKRQQSLSITLSVPLVDWGEQRSQYELAKRNFESTVYTLEQSKTDLEQDIKITVGEFNLQGEVVSNALEAEKISEEAYEIGKKRFILGSMNILNLSQLQSRNERASSDYLNQLHQYWKLHYNIRKITMYDFQLNMPLNREFELYHHIE